MTVPDTVEADLLVVGAGPAGLYAAYYAGFRGLSTAVVDSLPEPGGQVAAMYAEKLIYDVAGFPAIRGQELVDNLVAQAAPFEPRYRLGRRAETLQRLDDGRLCVTDEAGGQVCARAVLVTGGIGTFSPRPLPGGEAFVGRGLRFFVPRLDELAGLDCVVVGGGDSAVDWALALEPIARSVTVVHRRDRFRAFEHSVGLLRASTCAVLTPYQVAAITPDHDGAVAAVVVAGPDGEVTLPCQALVAALGFVADLGPIESWGLTLAKRHIVVDTTMATNLPGVWAAGDIADYPGKVRLISVGFGEAATAVNNAAHYLDPAAKVFPGHSSSLAVG